MKIRMLALLCALSALTACGNYTTARSSSDYADIISKHNMLILPVNATAYTVSHGSEERMYDYENHIEPIIADELSEALEAKGYNNDILYKEDLKKGRRYQQYDVFTDVFDSGINTIYENQEMSKKEVAANTDLRFDGKAKKLSAKVSAPVLVYANYTEKVKTSGMEAAEFAAGVLVAALTGVGASSGPPDSAVLRVSIIDGDQDRLLWSNAGASLGGDLVDDMLYDNEQQSLNHVKTTIKNALSELPDRDKLFEAGQ